MSEPTTDGESHEEATEWPPHHIERRGALDATLRCEISGESATGTWTEMRPFYDNPCICPWCGETIIGGFPIVGETSIRDGVKAVAGKLRHVVTGLF